MKLIQATVKFPAKTYTTRYGDRLNAVFTTDNGDEATIWAGLNYEPFQHLERGQSVFLTCDSQGKYRLLDPSESISNGNNPVEPNGNGQAPPSLTHHFSDERKRQLAAKVQAEAQLLKYCLETAQIQFSGLVQSEDSIRSLATTLFINALRP